MIHSCVPGLFAVYWRLFVFIVRKRPDDGSGSQTTMLIGCRFLETENGEADEEIAALN